MKIRRSRSLQSAKYLKKKRKKLIVTTSISILVTILSIMVIVLISRLSFFQIKNVNIGGAVSIDKVLMEQKIKDTLSGDYFHLIPKSNYLFYPKDEEEEILLKDFKKIDTLKISRQNLSTLQIDISERLPVVIICEGFRNDEDNSKCSYADKNGFVYNEIPNASSTGYFKYYTNNSIEPRKFTELQAFVKEVKDHDIDATGILIGEDGSYELYVKNKDQSIAVVYFDDRIPLDKTLSNLIAFWQSALDKKIGLDVMPNFDYINLRFGNNIFYLVK